MKYKFLLTKELMAFPVIEAGSEDEAWDKLYEFLNSGAVSNWEENPYADELKQLYEVEE